MFKTTLRMLFLLCTVTAAVQTFAADRPAPPDRFARLVPLEFRNGLKLVEIRERCKDCVPWRMVEIHADGAAAARQEKVSVADGVTAMYAFPGTGYFANTKIERSLPGRYAQDKAIVLEAVADACARMKTRVAAYVDEHPEVRQKLDQMAVKGRDYVEFESASYRGVEYGGCTQNAMGLMGGTVAELHIFVPRDDTIITAYLLLQKENRFKSVDEFLSVRREFIEGYIDFLQGQ
jgi:hypothetical protein